MLLKVEWGAIARYGFLTDADFTHDREEDIAYELEFTWIGDTDAAPKFNLVPKLDMPGLLKKMIQALQEVLDLLLEAFLLAFFAVLQVQQFIVQMGSLITGLIDLLAKFSSLALVPLELIGTLKQQLTSIALAVGGLIDSLRSVPAAYLEAAVGADSSTMNFAVGIADAIRFNASKLGADAIQQRRELERLEEDTLIGIFVAPGSITLRDVSTKFYGTPDNWTEIQSFNGFSSSTVPSGTVIRVPRLGSSGGGV
jgi:hypothetical protein